MNPASTEPRQVMLFRKSLRTLSLSVCGCLVLLSIVGFNKLAKHSVMSMDQVEATTSDGCLLFLGLTFGTLLFLGEFRWERFFFLFGFLRYRLGRTVLYAVSGIMTILVGRTRSGCTGCTEYTLLLAEGIALLVAGMLQLLAIPVLGANNTAPVEDKSASKSQLVAQPTDKAIDIAAVRLGSTRPAAPVDTRSPFEASVAAPTKSTAPSNPNLPAWMQA
ncbi:hypothetical protein SPRG_13043 [Saprolegnia parasitica CBS 223.65]|uniref:MARVEL domain-containing protein n=1 Tax=Saprolegnia parasitica (strain CBS 223.65) TaxID=695850 RepID=A0A067BY06_SAPPC|nr:hypothetical protein SPRG_13043 [Saprolegnia parasitica CBS 223.65]KDO21705.1 hypothetical protein SPRG_13043 [Saprolegnia parasitica CBS 223.65]|eukprot:XP_012207626.1 hypothetical protein SPRG_13043 [Saprolegnia parasitica CBS 223.65]